MSFFSESTKIHVEKVITVGAPFNGTVTAHRGPPTVREELNRDDQGKPSPILQELRKVMSRHPEKYYAIAGRYDFFVRPSGKDSIPPFIPVKNHMVYAGWGGHSYMMRAEAVHHQIQKWLEDPIELKAMDMQSTQAQVLVENKNGID